MLRWLCEIGRVDILTETSLLSTYLCSPRSGHLQQVLHVFKYLWDNKRFKCVFDPRYIDINDNHLPPEKQAFNRATYMSELYPDAIDDKPKNKPWPRGRKVQITCFVDAEHAGKTLQEGPGQVLIYVNRAPIIWWSKLQNIAQCSTYESELVVIRLVIEMIRALKYRLWVFD